MLKIALHALANRKFKKSTVMSLCPIALVLIITSQTNFVTEINAVKEFETTCIVEDQSSTHINRFCCEYEIDTETGEKTTLGCYTEHCKVVQGEEYACSIIDRSSGGSQEVLPTTPPTTTSDESVISDFSIGEQREVQPQTPSLPKNSTIEQSGDQQDRLANPLGNTAESDTNNRLESQE